MDTVLLYDKLEKLRLSVKVNFVLLKFLFKDELDLEGFDDPVLQELLEKVDPAVLEKL